jgi:hypothetical protein
MDHPATGKPWTPISAGKIHHGHHKGESMEETTPLREPTPTYVGGMDVITVDNFRPHLFFR